MLLLGKLENVVSPSDWTIVLEFATNVLKFHEKYRFCGHKLISHRLYHKLQSNLMLFRGAGPKLKTSATFVNAFYHTADLSDVSAAKSCTAETAWCQMFPLATLWLCYVYTVLAELSRLELRQSMRDLRGI